MTNPVPDPSAVWAVVVFALGLMILIGWIAYLVAA